ncbi:hypothetical protein BBJ28_00012691 [Nothophytophthora sp. Chile5]|nr:hypothetical protein BBJ28_00012691 [Nothophytophthora sp. Chile5]
MSPISPDAAALPPAGASPRAALQSWGEHEQWTDLCICVTCGFIGCFSSGHFSMHFQMHPKHFVGLQVASKTFWCTPCKMDIPENARLKVENARAEFQDALEEIAAKKRRQLRSQMRIAVPTTSSSASPTSTSNGSARSLLMELDAHADTPPVPRGALTLDTKRVVDIDIDDLDADAGTGSQRSNGSLTGTANGVAPLLSMPLRTKARDEKLRRRLLKTAMQKRGEPVKQQEPAETAAVTKEASENGATSKEGMPCSVLGFTNLGNTCYFNAPMQALLTATHYFPEHTHIEEMLETSNAPITTTFTMLHETVKKRARRALTGGSSSSSSASDKSGKNGKSSRSRSGSSSVLTVAPLLKEMRKKFTQFRGHYQQDAHELFTSFLWAIDEEMDPPLPASEDEEEPPKADTEACNGRSVTSSNGSTANSSEEVELTSSRQESWPEEDATDDSEAADADAELETEGEASGESETEGEEQETKQIFVKTETGETISMQVPQDATVKEVQHLLAKRLNLNEEDMMLDASKVETRATLSSRPSAVLHARAQRKTYSKLNFTRSLFGGALTTAVTCQACGKRTEIVEDAFHLSVSVPESSSHRVLSTIDCLTNFVSETKLLVEAKNGYDCEKCSRQPKVRSAAGRFMRKKRLGSSAEAETELILRDAAMKLYVSALPRVLVVHLKRLARSRKLTQHIAFEERLDMTPFVSDALRQGGGEARHHSLSYELIAVVVHMGNKRSGHYVAYVSRSKRREALLAARARSRHASEESATSPEPPTPTKGSESVGRAWFYVSDTVVKRVAVEQVLQCEAYMLFYQRRAKESTRSTPAASPTAKTLTEATL